ncbi:MAG TPA: maleylpyruvate isomerase family mycothiol-dependent enzyme [Vicinamibacterales bacterium]|nr:maleylpyruvate isomerase family mycothiol-dependent enzyme [Vicinamibacterales bacterium]
MSLPVTDTRLLFRPLCGEIVELLRTLAGHDWERSTMAGAWRVRDVVAHLLDTALRRLSFHRDRLIPPPGEGPAAPGGDLVAFINTLNATWIRAAERLSPRVMTDLYARASTELADFIETLNPHAAAALPVSWAGETISLQWLDTGREFTEVWHHGSQIRVAVGAGPFSDARWLRAVLQIALHALPFAYRDVPGRSGVSVAITITGGASGTWTLQHRDSGWDVDEGNLTEPTTAVTMSDETAWRLFFNALTLPQALSLVRLTGDAALALPLLRARSVIV